MEKPLCGSVWTKKNKIKDVFEGEKLFEGLEYKSLVLIEPTQPIKLGIEKSPKIIHLAQYLWVEEGKAIHSVL